MRIRNQLSIAASCLRGDLSAEILMRIERMGYFYDDKYDLAVLAMNKAMSLLKVIENKTASTRTESGDKVILMIQKDEMLNNHLIKVMNILEIAQRARNIWKAETVFALEDDTDWTRKYLNKNNYNKQKKYFRSEHSQRQQKYELVQWILKNNGYSQFHYCDKRSKTKVFKGQNNIIRSDLERVCEFFKIYQLALRILEVEILRNFPENCDCSPMIEKPFTPLLTSDVIILRDGNKPGNCPPLVRYIKYFEQNDIGQHVSFLLSPATTAAVSTISTNASTASTDASTVSSTNASSTNASTSSDAQRL
jgi:hypothetical protein